MNFFKNQFKKKEPSKDEPDDIISIKYAVTAEGEIEINLEWADSSSITSEMLGELITAVHSGTLDQSVLNILIEHTAENPESALFVSRVIDCWTSALFKNTNDLNTAADSAMVLPSQVFEAYKTTQ